DWSSDVCSSDLQSYLRGKRYNLEKKQGARTDITFPQKEGRSHTAERLAEEYHVAPATIERDGQYAEALDTLHNEVRPGIRESVLKGQDRGEQRTTKKQVIKTAKLVKEHKVKPLPCMTGWTDRQVLEAMPILTAIPETEYNDINALLKKAASPAATGLTILRNLRKHGPEQRQNLYTLVHSQDPGKRALVRALA